MRQHSVPLEFYVANGHHTTTSFPTDDIKKETSQARSEHLRLRGQCYCLPGVITQLDAEDYNPSGSGLIGLAGILGAFGSMCEQRLGIKPQS
jgi:hypothetical protein